MNKRYRGIYPTNFLDVLIFNVTFGLLRNESIEILEDRLILNKRDGKIELLKSEIKSISTSILWGGTRIYSSNPNFLRPIDFISFFPWSFENNLLKAGYDIKGLSNVSGKN